DFTVVTDATLCVLPTPTAHARSISFKIKKTGKASGVVSSTEDPAFTDCVAAVPVKIQRKKNGAWKTVGKTTTTATGSYTKKVKNPKGKQKFRALAPKVSLGDPVTDVCTKAKSAVRKICQAVLRGSIGEPAPNRGPVLSCGRLLRRLGDSRAKGARRLR